MTLIKTQAYINGKWTNANNGTTFAVTNPADGSHIADVADMGGAETKAAIAAAEKALPAWAAKSAKERSVILRRWYDLMLENIDELAEIMTREQGKPLFESMGEIKYAAAFLEWYAEEGKRAYGDVIPSPIANSRIVVQKQPIGVCALITPWNFPSAMITRKAGPALAAGCTCVCKPASDTPLSALALAELAEQAGVPPGVFNIVTGQKPQEISEELCANPTVRKLSFTGSTGVGKILMRQCADTIKKLSLELGGNAPFIVFDDADIDAAVQGALICKYRNAGQTCVCANRFYIHESVYDEFAEKLTAQVKEFAVGDGLKDGTIIGPMINDRAVDKVQSLLTDAADKGAEIKTGGKLHELGGRFFEPTVITNLNSDMEIAREEIFGPIATLFKFSTEEEVIQKANDTPYGLAAYFYSRDIGRVWRIAEALEYGMVVANAGILSTEVAPFGGIKESGLGREGSKYGLDEYLELKYILMADL